METDLLGPPYEQHVIDLGRDDEGPVVATLVRRRAPGPTRRAVLWVHGWCDYFFQTHVADYFADRGFDFYAVDLRKYGRSLREHQTPNFCRSLSDYHPELDEAARVIRTVDGHDTLLVAGHSTGALITALWAHRRRAAGVVDAMFLNSPFLDLNLPAPVRPAAAATVARLGRHRPYGVLPHRAYPVYGESLHVAYRGTWSYDLAWKPVGGFPIRYGWLAAVHAGQRRLHAGLAIDVPILVACSTRSYRSQHWHPAAHRADTVLDVADMTRWAPHLGSHVTIVRIDGGVHDLTLSAPDVRATLFSELARWLAAYVAGEPVPGRTGPAARASGRTGGGHQPAPGPQAGHSAGTPAAEPTSAHPTTADPRAADPRAAPAAPTGPAATPPSAAADAPGDRG